MSARVGQTGILARVFFSRLFESDLMPPGLPQVQVLIWGLIFAGAPTFGMPMLLAKKYTALYNARGDLPLAIATDRAILFTLSMLSMGFVALLIWDGIFPDRRDARILGALPVGTRTFVAARLLALGRVFVLFAVAICIPQALFFSMLAWSYGDPAGLMRSIAAHALTASAACTFVFAVLLTLQCLLLVVLGRRTAQRASVILQVAFAVGLIQLLFFLPQLAEIVSRREQAVTAASTGAAVFPAVWFLGLHEWLAGFAEPAARTLAWIAAASSAGTVLMSVLLYATSYSRLSRLALEGVPQGRGREPRQKIRQYIYEHTRGQAIAVAVRKFTLRTLVRVRQHRMVLALYAGVALALIVTSLLAALFQRDGPGLTAPGISLLSIPLVLQFLPLVGVRMLAAIPAEPKANWVFRAAEPGARGAAIDGVRDAMISTIVTPTSLLALLEGWLLWGGAAGLYHALFCWTLGALLVEILLASLGKIPFTCTYLPGRARLRTLWPFYFMAFTTYCYTMAAIELALMRAPFRLLAACAALLLVARAAMLVRHRALAEAPGLRFTEEDPSALFEGFRLSEGLAATARTPAD